MLKGDTPRQGTYSGPLSTVRPPHRRVEVAELGSRTAGLGRRCIAVALGLSQASAEVGSFGRGDGHRRRLPDDEGLPRGLPRGLLLEELGESHRHQPLQPRLFRPLDMVAGVWLNHGPRLQAAGLGRERDPTKHTQPLPSGRLEAALARLQAGTGGGWRRRWERSGGGSGGGAGRRRRRRGHRVGKVQFF